MLPERNDRDVAVEVRRTDLERQLEALRKKGRRHLTWALLGISPAAIIPASGLLAEGSTGLFFLLSGLVVVTQGFAWARSNREAAGVEKELSTLVREAHSL